MSLIALKKHYVRKSVHPSKRHLLRQDIQGLRAIAVLLVIADHLFKYPSGGFVGVDVFFVISGFLITGLQIREHQTTGRISFADFYRRRVKRILPLSVLVLMVTVVASWSTFAASRATRISEDGVWALLFGANWHFAIVGTDYMQSDGVVSPLQHFWSLAVEEQFYLLWPLLIIATLGFASSKLDLRPGQSILLLSAPIILIVFCSLFFSLWETTTAPTVAYFSTFSRAWELGVGALVAISSDFLKRIAASVRLFLAYAGLIGILSAAIFFTPSTPFPGPWALLPVLSTALVILAGTGGGYHVPFALANPAVRYIGDISFSLYLWHFPVIIMAAALVPINSPIDYAGILLLIFGLSALSYYFVEDAVRKSNWLEPKHKPRTYINDNRLAVGSLVGLTLSSIVVSGMALAKTAPIEVSQPVPGPLPSSVVMAGKEEPVTATGSLSAEIQAAVRLGTWPDLTPSIDNLGPAAKAPEWVNDGCLGMETKSLADPIANARRCIYGDPNAERTAVVLGDSMAISYLPTIRSSLEPQGYKVLVLTMQQCPWARVSVLQGNKAPHTQCDPFREWAQAEVERLKPELTLLSSNHSIMLASGATGRDFETQWKEGVTASLSRLANAGGRIIILDAPPSGKALDACATRISKPSECETKAEGLYEIVGRANKQVSLNIKVGKGVELINTKQWFCSPDNRCPAFIGNTPVYADGFHLTAKFATRLGPVLTEAINSRSTQ